MALCEGSFSRLMNRAGRRRSTGAIDAGWLFVLSGAAILSAAVLIPPSDNLAQLKAQRDQLALQVSHEHRRLEAYATFLEALDQRDPTLIRRIAVSHLNLIPETVEPVAMIAETAEGFDAHVDNWIEQTLPAIEWPDAPKVRTTWLRRLSSAPHRLWTMLAGMICIFIGLLPQARSRVAQALPSTEPDSQPPVEDEANQEIETSIDDQELLEDDGCDAPERMPFVVSIGARGSNEILDENESLVWVQRSAGPRPHLIE